MARRLDPSDLEKVACSGDVEKVMKLLDMSSTHLSENQDNRPVRLNVNMEDVQTALILAIDRDHVVSIQTLVIAGADINSQGTGLSFHMPPLMYALYLKRVSCVSELLQLGADMNCMDNEGRTALMLAAMYGRDQCLQLLINAGANVNFQNKEIHLEEDYIGRTVLMYAAEYHKVNLLKMLLEAGADVNVKTSKGLTALHWAVKCVTACDSVRTCIKILLDHGADCNAQSSYGETALMVMMKNIEPTNSCVKLLTDSGTDVNKKDVKGFTALMIAVRNDHLVNLLSILVKAGAVIDQEDFCGMTALEHAFKCKSYQCVRWLVESEAYVPKTDSKGQTALMYAAKSDSSVSLLPVLTKKAVIDQQDSNGMTALAHAVKTRSFECVRWLVNSGANVNTIDSEGQTVLMYAAMGDGRIRVHLLPTLVKDDLVHVLPIFVQAGAVVDQQDSTGMTALGHAVSTRSHECVRWLLDAGASVNICDHFGRSPLELAIYNMSLESIQWLLDSGADVTKVDNQGQTVLMHAVKNNWMVDVLPKLVTAGVTVDQQDSSGMTALAHAVSSRNHECVSWLLDAGASINICDHSGKTPLHRLNCLEILLSRNPDVNAKDNNGMTPLMYVARERFCDTRAMNMLLGNGADINLVDNHGHTALFHSLRAFFDAVHHVKEHGKAIKLLIDKGANVGTEKLSTEILSRLTESDYDLDLLKLEVGDKVDRTVLWTDFVSVIIKGNRRILQFLIINKVMATPPELGLISVRDTFNEVSLSLLENALRFGNTGIAKYFMATCYLRNSDLKFTSAGPSDIVESNNPEVVNMMESLRSQPLPLVKLCFVAVSTVFGPSPGRQERVKNSQLPFKLKNMLLFQEPLSRLCVHQWDEIPLTLSPEMYEKLPRPRPLLYNWPVGRALVQCDCGECDGTMYKYDLG